MQAEESELDLVVQVSETFRRGDVEEAQEQRQRLTGTGTRLIEETTEKVRFLQVTDEEQEEEKALHRRIGSAEDSLRQQKASVNSLEAEKSGMNAVLEEHKQELQRAESRIMTLTDPETFDLAVQVSETFIRGDLKEAQERLQRLTGIATRLIEETTEKVRFFKVRDEKLKEEEKELHRKIGSAEGSLRQLKASVNSLEAEKAGMNAVLEDSIQLQMAESEMRDAERRKENSTTGTVAGSVAADLLGIFFPPSLAVTVPAVAAIGGITIAEAQKIVDQNKRAVSEKENSISNKSREIECNISALESRKRSLEQARGQLRQTIMFLQQAITYFEELKVATEGGKEQTELLHRIAEKLTARATYPITSSKEAQEMCRPFKETWASVKEKLNAGEQYLAITWQ